MVMQRKQERRSGDLVIVHDGESLAHLTASLQRVFPGVAPGAIFLTVLEDDGDVALRPYITVLEPENDYLLRVAHEERIAREREIAQADSDRQQRRMLYDKLKAEFEGDVP